jgi:hypothetical protein
MKVISIDPNTKKYFEDTSSNIDITNNVYAGIYKLTPVFPLYTFNNTRRFDYTAEEDDVIKFYTMLPIKRLFCDYFVEVEFTYSISIFKEEDLNVAIEEFNKFCKMNIRNLNVKALVTRN